MLYNVLLFLIVGIVLRNKLNDIENTINDVLLENVKIKQTQL